MVEILARIGAKRVERQAPFGPGLVEWMAEHGALGNLSIDCGGNPNVRHARLLKSCRAAIGRAESVDKRTLTRATERTAGTFQPKRRKGREAMYIGIGGLVLLIIILIILFR